MVSEAERIRLYEYLALERGVKCRVSFSSALWKMNGCSYWDAASGCHRVELDRNLSLREELRLFAHELGHVLLGHCAKKAFTPKEMELARDFNVIVGENRLAETGILSRASVSRITADYWKQEADADTAGAYLLTLWSIQHGL
jgi:hypothetical protein